MIGVKLLWGLPKPKTSELQPSLGSFEVVTKLHCKRRPDLDFILHSALRLKWETSIQIKGVFKLESCVQTYVIILFCKDQKFLQSTQNSLFLWTLLQLPDWFWPHVPPNWRADTHFSFWLAKTDGFLQCSEGWEIMWHQQKQTHYAPSAATAHTQTSHIHTHARAHSSNTNINPFL